MILTINLSSQSLTWDSFIAKLNEQNITYEELIDIIDENNNPTINHKNGISFELLVNRDLSRLDSCQESLYKVFAIPEKGYRLQKYTIRILSRKNQIVKFTSWDSSSKVGRTILNESLFQQYKSDFQTANYIVNTSGVFEPDMIFNVSISGGRSTHPTPKFKELLNLIRTKNKSTIIEWSQSTSPEIRCYGAVGLSGLNKLNHPLTENELKLLARLSNDTTVINYSLGCTKSGYKSTVKEMFDVMKSSLKYYVESALYRTLK